MTWPILSLGEVVLNVRNGLFARRPNDEGRGTPILRISAVRHGKVDLSDSRFVEGVTDAQLSKFRLEPDDLLMTRYNGSRHLVGIAGLVPSLPEPFLHPDKLIRLEPDRTIIDPRFLVLQLQGRDVRAFLEPRIRTTAGQSGIAGGDVRSIPLTVPDLREQRRIVEILEVHLSHLDAASMDLARARARLDSLIEAALRCHVKSDTATRPLADVLEMPLANGRSVPSRDDGFPVLRLTALKEGGVDLAERKGGAWERADAIRFLVRRGDFLIARGNGSLRLVGKGSLVRSEPDEVAFPDTVIRARPRPVDLSPEFLDLVWNARATRDQIERVARTSAGIYKVNQGQLGAIQLPVPALSEQRSIIAAMDRLRDHRQGTLEAIDVAAQRNRGLRRAVLAAAFDGKLTGRHTDEEVIEELAEA